MQRILTTLSILIVPFLIGYVFMARPTLFDTTSPHEAQVIDTLSDTPSSTPPLTPPTPVVHERSARVPIVVYHGLRTTTPSDPHDVRQFNLDPAVFEAQLDYLAHHDLHTITMRALAEHLTQGTPLPERPVALVFDDGWATQYTEALPRLKAHGMVATFFLYPNVLDHEHYLTTDEARALVAEGHEIGSHSMSHQYMNKQDTDALTREIAGSKALLESLLGTTVTSFAYPFGVHTDMIDMMLDDAGYTIGRTLGNHTTHTTNDRFSTEGYLVRPDMDDFSYFLLQAP